MIIIDAMEATNATSQPLISDISSPCNLSSCQTEPSIQGLTGKATRRRIIKRETFVFLSTLLMASARAADVMVTYRFSPDLALEGNPMIRILGMGWPFLLVVNLLAVAAFAACSVYWLRSPLQYERSTEVRDVWSFASFASFHRVYPRRAFIWKRLLCTPKSWKHTVQLFGVVAPPAIVAVSIAAVVSWYAMYSFQWDTYSALYNAFWPVFPYAIVIPLIWIATATFYRSEYQRYCAASVAP